MSDAFQDRENTFEKQFAHDEDLRFKAVARRNKALALWVAEMKKLLRRTRKNTPTPSSPRRSARATTKSPPRSRRTSRSGDIDLSDHRLRKKMDEEMAEAIASVRAGK